MDPFPQTEVEDQGNRVRYDRAVEKTKVSHQLFVRLHLGQLRLADPELFVDKRQQVPRKLFEVGVGSMAFRHAMRK